MCNQKIRDKARIADVALWQIADRFGITNSTFSVWLRRELPEEKQKMALDFIDQIVAERKKKGNK